MKKQIVVDIIEVKLHPTERATNFDIRIEKAEAERLLRGFGGRLRFEIMCKEYGEDKEAAEKEAADCQDGIVVEI
jgi:hypothetical protein